MRDPLKPVRRLVGQRLAASERAVALRMAPALGDGLRFADGFSASAALPRDEASTATAPNPLRDFVEQRETGRGIWKKLHYLDIYHRHFERFVGTPVDVLEIGVYSGGSLDMWRAYFGEGCHVHGVDIEPACEVYADDGVSIAIGDQADRRFWAEFRHEVPGVDIIIDDGGHLVDQQRVTLEETLGWLRPGGIYLCEDVHGRGNDFAAFALGLASALNATDPLPGDVPRSRASGFQAWIDSVHVYPYVVVIEKRATPIEEFSAPKHGTEWQPHL